MACDNVYNALKPIIQAHLLAATNPPSLLMALFTNLLRLSGHTSSDSDSRSSMDAIAREPSKRKRSVRRKKTPRTRATHFDYEPGMEYAPSIDRIYEPMPPVSPAPVEPDEVRLETK